jgi:hypothetical protein
MKKLHRENNPFSNPELAYAGPEWGVREGNENGYNNTFGIFGSAARGWVDQPHDRSEDLKDKILRERFVPSPEEHEEEEEYGVQDFEVQPAAPSYAGRGPKKSSRTDEWLREEISDRLFLDGDIDASEIEVEVHNGEVTLKGSVPERQMKYWAEDRIEKIHGVKVLNIELKVLSHPNDSTWRHASPEGNYPGGSYERERNYDDEQS